MISVPSVHEKNDPIQEEHPDMRGGANVMSLYEAKQAYKSGAKVI